MLIVSLLFDVSKDNKDNQFLDALNLKEFLRDKNLKQMEYSNLNLTQVKVLLL